MALLFFVTGFWPLLNIMFEATHGTSLDTIHVGNCCDIESVAPWLTASPHISLALKRTKLLILIKLTNTPVDRRSPDLA